MWCPDNLFYSICHEVATLLSTIRVLRLFYLRLLCRWMLKKSPLSVVMTPASIMLLFAVCCLCTCFNLINLTPASFQSFAWTCLESVLQAFLCVQFVNCTFRLNMWGMFFQVEIFLFFPHHIFVDCFFFSLFLYQAFWHLMHWAP